MDQQSVYSNDPARPNLCRDEAAANHFLDLFSVPPAEGHRQVMRSHFGLEIIDVDALYNSDGETNEIPPLPQKMNENTVDENINNENQNLVTAEPMAQRIYTPTSPVLMAQGGGDDDGERDERQIETPRRDEWNNGSPLPDREDFVYNDDDDDDTSSVMTMSDILHQRLERRIDLDRREQKIKDKERELEIREKALSTGNEKELKKKVDEWLGKPREHRDLIIDHEIIGFAMNQHPYLWLKPEDRRRVNCVRYELDKMKEIVERNEVQDYCCPICFETIKTNRSFSAPECGHTHCDDCIKQMDRIVGPNKNARCGKCLMEINMDKVRRIFFASRK